MVYDIALVSLPVHDEQIVSCENCNGHHWIETCGHPETRSGVGGACCGACEPIECSSCGDSTGPYPYGTAPIEWDEDTPLDWLVIPREIADDDYPGHFEFVVSQRSIPVGDDEIPF